jgi:GNAT superfamily N-acetyltransferase
MMGEIDGEIKLVKVQYRLAREAELPQTVELFLTTVADLRARQNLQWPLPPREYVLKAYSHIWRTGLFHVAEVDGKVIAICHAVVRGHLWFLSGFWTHPTLQGQKIGGPLLRRVWEEGERAGASIFFTWSSTDLQAMAAYMKFGMLPGYQALTFAGVAHNLKGRGGVYETQPLDPSNAMAIDEKIRATRREMDHTFWFSEMKAQARQVSLGGNVVGYYYFNQGTIGPAAWLEEKNAEALMESACREASKESEQVRMMIPGPNHAAIRFALKVGLKLSAYAHLLTTASFGQMEKYLASGPSLY